jgi:hypothetical protein
MRVVIADCFILNFTSLAIKVGHQDGTVEFLSPSKYQNKNNQFSFTMKSVANFSIYQV